MARLMVWLLWVALAATGCVTPIKSQFDEAPLTAIRGPGHARVAGQAFAKTRGGEIRTPREVLLLRFSAYTQEVVTRGILVRDNMFDPDVDPRLLPHIRRAICDAEGRFEFEAVPDGEYFLTSGIYWEAPSAYGDSPSTTGSAVYIRVDVYPSTYERVGKLILTP